MSKSWLRLVLNLIGWEGGASFLEQSQIKVKQTKAILSHFRRSIEKCSNDKYIFVNWLKIQPMSWTSNLESALSDKICELLANVRADAEDSNC